MSSEGKEPASLDKKDIGKLYGLGLSVSKPNIGDAIDDDDEFEELVSNIDYVEGEIESIRDTLNEMRSQIADLRRRFGKRVQEGKNDNSATTSVNIRVPNGSKRRNPSPEPNQNGLIVKKENVDQEDVNLKLALQLSLNEH